MRNTSRFLALLLCLLMVVSMFAACGNNGNGDDKPSGGTTNVAADVPANRYDGSNRTGANATTPLVVSTLTLDGKFSPFFYTSGHDEAIVSNTQLTLITNSAKAEPVAGLNEPTYALSFNMNVADDQSSTEYEFILKNGLTFSDGKPVTALDVLFTLYMYLDPMYDGSSTLYSMDIQGLQAYRTQTPDATQAAAKLEEFAKNGAARVEAVLKGEGTEEDTAAVWELLRAGLTADSATLVGSGYVPADFGLDQPDDFLEKYAKSMIAIYCGFVNYDAASGAFVVADGVNLDPAKIGEYTEEEFINACFDAIKASMTIEEADENFGYDIVAQANDAFAKDEQAKYLDSNKGAVKSISGIQYDKVKCEDGVERERIRVTINGVDPKAIWNFGIPVTPMHYYSTEELAKAADGKENFGVSFSDAEFMTMVKGKNTLPMGAGPYKVTDANNSESPAGDAFFSNGIAYFVANDSFCLGAPKIKYMRYKTVVSGSEFDSLANGEVHYTDPQASATLVNKITAEYPDVGYTLVDNLGYGYIGINAKLIPSLEVRQALASAMNTELTLDSYPGGLAEVIYRGMSQVSWAYPTGCTNMFPYDATGEASKALFLKAGYTYDEATNTMKDPSGKEATFTFTLPAAAEDHPAGKVFLDAQSVLAKIGVKVNIEVDENVLNKLDQGIIAVWAAAWQATIDPDMFQIWYSDAKVNTATSPVSFGLYWLYENGTDAEKAILTELNEKILAGRTSLNVDERKPIYTEALDLAMQLAVEIPTYQRKNMYVYDKTVINENTLYKDITPYRGPLFEIWNVELVG